MTILPEALGHQPWDRTEPLEYEGGVRLSPWKKSKLDDWGATIFLSDGIVIARTTIWQPSGDFWRWKIDYDDDQVEVPFWEGDEDFDDTEPFDREMSLAQCMNDVEEFMTDWNKTRITRERRKELRENWFKQANYMTLACSKCREFVPVGKFNPATCEGALYPSGDISSVTAEFMIKHMGHELITVGERIFDVMPGATFFNADDEGWYL